MDFIMFIYYFITICIGMFCMGCLYTSKRNNSNEIIKFYLLTYSSFTLFILILVFKSLLYKFYKSIGSSILGVMTLMQLLSIVFILLTLSYIVNKLFLVPFSRKSNIILTLMSGLLFVIAIAAEYFEETLVSPIANTIFEYIHNIFFLAIFIYIVAIFIIYRKNLKNKKLISVITRTILITVIFSPLMIFDEIYSNNGVNLITVPLFYLVISILSLYSFQRFDELTQTNKYVISDEYKQKYNISPRESEVIVLLLKGYSYNKIASELVISISTVRTHTTNVYKKLGVTSRYELYNVLG